MNKSNTAVCHHVGPDVAKRLPNSLGLQVKDWCALPFQGIQFLLHLGRNVDAVLIDDEHLILVARRSHEMLSVV